MARCQIHALFMMSGAHRDAMPRLSNWCDEAALAQWETDANTLPGWEVAEKKLASEGRISQVKHPSPAQAAGRTLGEGGSQ